MSALLAIATGVSLGSSRLAKVPGSSKKNGLPIQRQVAHVGRFKLVEIRHHGCTRTFWREVENLAEFDGPTAYSAAVKFAQMLAAGRTHVADMSRCVADGPPPPPVPLWRRVEAAQVELLTDEAKEPEPEPEHKAEAPATKKKRPKKDATHENK